MQRVLSLSPPAAGSRQRFAFRAPLGLCERPATRGSRHSASGARPRSGASQQEQLRTQHGVSCISRAALWQCGVQPAPGVNPAVVTPRSLRAFGGGTRLPELGREGELRAEHSGHFALSHDGRHIYGVVGGWLYAISASSGARRWRSAARAFAGPPLASPDGARVFAAGEGRLRVFAAASGHELWACQLCVAESLAPGPLKVSPDGTLAFIGSLDGKLHAVNVASGQQRWEYEVGDALPQEWSFSLTPDGAIVVFWAGDGQVHAVDTASGKQRWAKSFGDSAPVKWSFLASPDGSLVFFATEDGVLRAVSVASGEQRWAQQHNVTAREVFMISPDGARLVFGTAGGKLKSLGVDAGEEQWAIVLNEQTPTTSVMGQDGVTAFVGDCNGCLHAVSTKSGESRWFYEYGESDLLSCALHPNGNTVFVQTRNRDLHAVDVAKGVQRWVNDSDDYNECPPLVGKDGSRLFLSNRIGNVQALKPISGEVIWEQRLSEPDRKRLGEAPEKYKFKLADIIRNKRYAVVLVLVAVVQLRSSGWLRRPNTQDSVELESIFGKPIANFLAAILGLQQRDMAAHTEDQISTQRD